MYYRGKTTGKEIIKQIWHDLPLIILWVVILYFTFGGVFKFLYNIILGDSYLLYIEN